MNDVTTGSAASASAAEQSVRLLYQQMLDGWNRRNAAEIAGLYTEDGNIVGFDGSQMNGRGEIQAELSRIFADHPTAAYVGIVREVRLLAPGVAVLRAVSGMVPPGGEAINPAVNTVQTLVAANQQGTWRIALYQNTPAAYHGRPELSQQLTAELQQALDSR
jgi:uncharacterized protein (TIGR02246 family)